MITFFKYLQILKPNVCSKRKYILYCDHSKRILNNIYAIFSLSFTLWPFIVDIDDALWYINIAFDTLIR